MVKLGEVAGLLNGFAFDSRKFSQEQGTPLIRIRDVKSGTTSTFYDGQFDPKYLIHPGEIIVGMDGDFNCSRWGEVPALLNQRVCKVYPKSPKIDDDYLYFALPRLLREIWIRTPFVTVKHLSSKVLLNASIPLPPLKEQKRIARILTASVRQVKKVREEIAILDSMETGIVNKFTEEIDRHVTLSDIATFSGGMTPSKRKTKYWNGDIPWFSSKDLKEAQLSDSIDHLSDIAVEETSIKPLSQPGIAISMRGMSLAHSIPSSCIPAGSCVNQDLKVVTPKSSQSLHVLHALIRQKENYLLSKVATSAHGTRKLDFEYLRNLQVPDLPESKVRFLDTALVVLRSQKSIIRKKICILEELHRSLEVRAFIGEL